MIGLERSAIGTLVERSTRFTMLVHLSREEGFGVIAPTKNGPPLAGYAAIAMKNALASIVSTLPGYFADPRSPWQRGTNENTNGLLRQPFPKGTNVARWTNDDLKAVAHALNTGPRKTLGWRTPAEALNDWLLSQEQTGVASTG